MRRRPGWTTLTLTLTSLLILARPTFAAETPAPTKPTKVDLGRTYTYETLGKLAMTHMGRIKPLDTVAREEVKSIYTRESIKLTSADGKTVTTWSPVAAFFDWSVRPKFWDEQPIIALEYLPLKRMIFAEEIKNALEIIAGKATTNEAGRKRIKDLIADAEIDSAELRSIVKAGKLDEADALTIEKLAAKIGEETKWVSPGELETADVTVDGKKMPFLVWLDGLSRRNESAPMMSGKAKPTELEKKADDLGGKLAHYRAIRDKQGMSQVPLLVMPRPANEAMLKFSGDSLRRAQETRGEGVSEFELEAAGMLFKYHEMIADHDRAMPGTDSKFDAHYTQWLKERSPWVPLAVLREAKLDELARAGFPSAKVEAFLKAYKAMEDAELTNPGRAAEQPAIELIAAATDLGDTINDSYYPSLAAMARETHFNELAPFFKAPIAYGLGVLALTLSLISINLGKSVNLENGFGKISSLFYLGGLASFAAGIGLEVWGFVLRILITGWAPVTNMYETVIWVGMIAAVLGMTLEMVYKRTWAALAGSGIALVCTGLAATVPLLDPDIHMLPPVLRSNFWLSIHVLTIVSSYAAFALAMGLGMAATTLYMNATYKRSAGFLELAKPLVYGLPLLFLGVVGYYASYGHFGAGEIVQSNGFLPSVIIGCIGGVMSASSLFAIGGEIVNRVLYGRSLGLDHANLADDPFGSPSAPPITPDPIDYRTLSMQATAAQIKPIVNFIYRSLQVGILLVTAGTILGGVWADYSWGRFWGWDPKEVWALITLLVYLIPLHGRFAGWVNTFWMVMASVVCFLSVLMAWYGVNFVLGVGLHSYGFTEGGGQGIVGVVSLVVLSYAFGAAWRRHVSQSVLTLKA